MRARSTSWVRPIGTFVGLLVAYYAFPLRWTGASAVGVILSLMATVGGLGLAGWVMVKELGYVRRGVPGRGVRVLAMSLILLVMAYSLTFFVLDQARPAEVEGLQTRTDALYFTLSTMSTVGYGDVHAEGQVARAMVCLMLIFNVVVVASLVRAQTRALPRAPTNPNNANNQGNPTNQGS